MSGLTGKIAMNKRSIVPVRVNLKCFHGRPDLTPLIDVLFLLLIFVMLSSSFVKVSGIKVDLPEVDAQRSLSVEKVVVTVDRGGQVFFKSSPITLDSLKQRLSDLSNLSDSATIILRADNKTPFGTVAKIMSLAEEAKLNVFVATIPPDVKRDVPKYYEER